MGGACLWHGVVVDVDDLVEVLGDNSGHVEEGVEVVLAVGYEAVEGDRGQVAYSHLSGVSVLDDLSAKVARLDCPKVLKVQEWSWLLPALG